MIRLAARVVLSVVWLASAADAQNRSPEVRIATSFGDITIELDTVHAPVTTANFLKYVDGGFYTNGPSRPSRPPVSERFRQRRSSGR